LIRAVVVSGPRYLSPFGYSGEYINSYGIVQISNSSHSSDSIPQSIAATLTIPCIYYAKSR
jgi:hypothetical protein